MGHVLLILAGGTASMAVPLLIARALVERHANATAAAIRKQHPQPIPAPVQTRPRHKELVR